MGRASEFWDRALRARDELEARFLGDSDVALIDVGYKEADERRTEEIVLRIHVRGHSSQAKSKTADRFPQQVDGIPVVVLVGDYHLESEDPRP